MLHSKPSQKRSISNPSGRDQPFHIACHCTSTRTHTPPPQSRCHTPTQSHGRSCSTHTATTPAPSHNATTPCTLQVAACWCTHAPPMQTASTPRRTRGTSSAGSFASPWRGTSLCATNPSRCGCVGRQGGVGVGAAGLDGLGARKFKVLEEKGNATCISHHVRCMHTATC